MRLERLDLLRYGPFDDLSLRFDPAARVTLVYGPNEAGKSSALAALSELLFDFHPRSPYAYRFKTSELRLGGVVSREGGAERLAFHRRKGNKAVLRAPEDDRPLDDDALAPFLGELSKEAFEQLFALDAARLRSGGEALLENGGALGESLLAAGAALGDVARRRATLTKSADALFNPRRKTASLPLYEAFERYEAARKAFDAAKVTPQGLEAARRGKAEAETALSRARADRDMAEAAAALAERARLAAPSLRARDAARAALEEFGALARVPIGRGAEIRHALEAARKAADRRAEAEQETTAARDAHAALPQPSPALAARRGIEALGPVLARAEAALRDLPEARAELDQAQAQQAALARRLGVRPEALAEAALSDAARAELDALITQGRRLVDQAQEDARGASPRRPAESLTERLAEAEAQFAALSAPARAFADAERARERLREAERRLAEAFAPLARLAPDVATLAARPGPGRAAIERFAEAFERLDREDAAAEQEARALAEEREQIEERLAAAREEGAPPSAEDLAAARAARDAEWRRIRAAKFEGLDSPEPVSPERYEAAVAAADGVADDRFRNVDRVARIAQETRQLERNARRQEALRERAGKRDEERQRLVGEWEAQWRGLEGSPPAPAQSRDWPERREAALEAARLVESCAAKAAEAARMATREAEALGALAEALALPAARPQTAEDAQAALDAARAALDALRRRARLDAGLADWRRRAARSSHAVGAPEDIGDEAWLQAASAAREAAALAPGVLENEARARRAVSAAEAAVAALRDALATLDAEFGAARPEREAPSDPAALAARARQRLAALAEDQEREKALLQSRLRQEAAEKALADCAAQAREAEAALVELAERVGTTPEALAQVADALDRKDAAAAALQEAEAALLRDSGGHDEATLRREIDSRDDDALAAAAAQRRAEAAVAAETYEAAVREDAEAQRRLGALETDRGAAAAAREMEAALAEASLLAEEWLTLRAGDLLLAEAAKRYREAAANPLLERASRAFAALTDGAFAGLDIAFDGQGVEHIVGVRPGGEQVAPGGMSEGARDQLFLALRIAAIERWAESRMTAPFIGDDLFASFDDARAAAGFRALAELGETTQVILFTHHRHLATIGQRALGSALDVIELDGEGRIAEQPAATRRRAV